MSTSVTCQPLRMFHLSILCKCLFPQLRNNYFGYLSQSSKLRRRRFICCIICVSKLKKQSQAGYEMLFQSGRLACLHFLPCCFILYVKDGRKPKTSALRISGYTGYTCHSSIALEDKPGSEKKK